MSEEELKELIEDELEIEESVPNKALIVPSYVLDYGYLENAIFYGNGKCLCTDISVQIDLYYSKKNELLTAMNKLKSLLIEKGMYNESEKYFDSNTKLWRATYKIITR